MRARCQLARRKVPAVHFREHVFSDLSLEHTRYLKKDRMINQQSENRAG